MGIENQRISLADGTIDRNRKKDRHRGDNEQTALNKAARFLTKNWLATITSFFMLAGYVVVGISAVYWTGGTFVVVIIVKKVIGGLPDGSRKFFHIRLRRQSEGGLTKWGP